MRISALSTIVMLAAAALLVWWIVHASDEESLGGGPVAIGDPRSEAAGSAAARSTPGPPDATREPVAAPPPASGDQRLTIVTTFPDGQPVESGELRVGLEHDGETNHRKSGLVDGRADLRVPHGAVLAYASLEPVEIELPQVEWQAGDIRTSGFVELDALEQWTADPAFDPRIDTDRTLQLTVSPGLEVSGRVVDASTGRGIEAAWVLVRSAFDSAAARSGPDGRFRVRGCEPLDPDFDTTVHVSAWHPRYPAGRAEVPVEPDRGSLTDVELRLEPGVYLSGTVVAASAQPVARAEVALLTDRQPGTTFDRVGFALATSTDDAGHFEFWGVEPAVRAELRVTDVRSGLVEHVHGPFALEADRTGVVVAIPSTAEVRLRPLLPDGSEPDPRQCVVAVAVDGEVVTTRNQLEPVVAVPVGHAIEWTVHCLGAGEPPVEFVGAAQDRFDAAGPVVRDVRLEPIAQVAEPADAAGDEVSLDGVASTSRMNVRSPRLAHTFVVEVVERDAGGRPVSGTTVQLTLAGGSATAALGEQGRAAFVLPAGHHWCSLEVPGRPVRYFELSAPAGGRSLIRLELPAPR